MAVAARSPVVDPGPWAQARRVLCVRADGMGDVLMTGPAVRALAAAGPGDRSITMLTSPAGTEVARLLEGVDDVIEHPVPWVAPGDGEPRGDRELLVELLDRSFDAVVVFTVSTQSPLPAAMLCRLAGIPRRLAHCRENPYGLLTDWIPEPERDLPRRHEVQRQLALVRAVGAHQLGGDPLAVRLGEGAAPRARAALVGAGVDPDERWLPIHPGAAASSRRYPPEGFAAAADTLATRGWRIVLTGSDADRDQVAATARAMRSGQPAFVTGLAVDVLAALLESAPVLVTNNTGPAHLAAAVGTPVVDLYALTNPQHAPWGVPHRLLYHDVPCRNCYRSECPLGHHLCLRGVEPSAIDRAVSELVPMPRALDDAVRVPSEAVG